MEWGKVSYKSADSIFPEQLLEEIQKYIQGEYVYIPRLTGVRMKWGEKSGGRDILIRRNQKIRDSFNNGCSISQLSLEYCLSVESIKKIVYKK
jgi:Mor family transcriptional regulator